MVIYSPKKNMVFFNIILLYVHINLKKRSEDSMYRRPFYDKIWLEL